MKSPYEHIEHATNELLAKRIAEIARHLVGEDKATLEVAARRLGEHRPYDIDFCSECFE